MIDYNLPYLFETLNPEEHLADLSGEEWTKELLNPDLVTYEDGKIYGFPFQSSSGITGMLYNKTVFEENNLEIPTTSAEFDEVCTVLKEKEFHHYYCRLIHGYLRFGCLADGHRHWAAWKQQKNLQRKFKAIRQS